MLRVLKTPLICLAALCALPAARAEVPAIFVTACAFGTHGDASMPRVRTGESAEVEVAVFNSADFLSTVTVEKVSFVIHHQTGDVTLSNVLSGPVDVPCWEQTTVVRSIGIPATECDILLVDARVIGSYDPDGPGPLFVARPFEALLGVQLVVSKHGPPTLNIVPSGADTLEVSWSLSYENWQLATNDDITGQWSLLSDTPSIDHGAYVHTFGVTDGPRRFFRLEKPGYSGPPPPTSPGLTMKF